MDLHKYIPTHLTVFLVAGIILGNVFSISLDKLFIVVITAGGILFLLKIKASKTYYPTYGFTIGVWFLFLIIGMISISLHKPENTKNHYIHFLNEKPQKIVLEITDILKSSKKYHKAYAEVLLINNQHSKGKILINIPKNDSIIIGQQFLVNSLLSDIPSPKNPHQFDYKKYLQENGIYHQLFLKNKTYKIQNIHKNLFYYLAQWRQKMTSFLSKNGMKDENLSIVKALLLGERQSISKELRQSYSNAGVIHILAISGLHIGIIWIILSFLFKPLRNFKYGKTLSVLLIITFLWIYAIFVGMSASVVRAVTMFTIISIGKSLNYPIKTVYSLTFSLFLLLLIYPLFLFSIGFQMSYLAVFGIIWIQPKLVSLWQPNFKLINYFWQLTTVSVAAQIGVLPLSLYYFHQFPSLFFISNWIIIPFLGIILSIGFLMIVLIALNICPPFFVKGYDFIIDTMNFFVKTIAEQEAFLFQNISLSKLSVLFLYATIITFFYWTEKKHFYRFIPFLIGIICLQGLFLFENQRNTNKKQWIVFQQYNNNVNAIRNSNTLTCYTADSIRSHSTIQNYALGEHISKITYKKPFKYFGFYNHKILIADSLGCYQYKNIQPTIILLQNSPKIHLERLILKWKPQLIIADNSNYPFFINRWQTTCRKENTPFHDISQKGAFILNLNTKN